MEFIDSCLLAHIQILSVLWIVLQFDDPCALDTWLEGSSQNTDEN